MRMAMKKKLIFRVTDDEAKLLADYAEATGRNQSDLLREWIRSLKARLARLVKE